ncbi:helix-turn-helix domain-containing protein [Amycolatopsis sp. SID8362]|uniref:helix-turn-helix domain-containing protein n=1 Tax=Amycolatopsis sp. SID8362 TaxID=2690346 RepID=UPI001EF1E134|nr:helix-turn-helix domain-containing protein [Amycolatopsis sp. SID8362]
MSPGRIEAARRLYDAGHAPADIAMALGVSRATIYRHLPTRENKTSSDIENNDDKAERDEGMGALLRGGHLRRSGCGVRLRPRPMWRRP